MPEKTPIEKVYDQLSGAPIRHPASARLFADWRLQAGDVVTVTSGNEAYQVPVYNMEMTWKGSPMVEVDATGSKERPPLTALARRSYGGSQRQAETEETLVGYSSRFDQTDSQIVGIVSATGIVVDPETGLPVIDPVTGDYVFAEGSRHNIFSQITQQAGRITSEVTRLDGVDSTLSSRISQTESDISLVVTGTSGNRKVNSASIILAINGGSGSSVTISADKVDLVGYVTATQMETAIQTVNYIIPADGTIQVSGHMDVGGNLGVGSISTESYADYKVDGTSIGLGSGIKGFGTPTTSGGQVSIPYYSFDGLHDGNITFSRAVTASGEWSGGTFTVSADQGVMIPAEVKTYLYAVRTNGDTTKRSGVGQISVPVRVIADGTLTTGKVVFTDTVPVTITEILDDQNTFTTNGTKNPRSGYVGFASVNVNVTLNDPTWGETKTGQSNTYTVKSSAGDSKSQTLYLTASGATVTLRTGSVQGDQQAVITCNDANLVAANIKNGVSIFGVTGTYTDTVTIDPSTATSLNPGGSVTVHAKKNGTSVASVTVSANTDGNLVAGNIKSGVSIFGVTGTYVPDPITLNDPTWNDVSSLTARRTYTVSATNGDAKSQTVLLYNNGNWSSGKTTVYMYKNSTASTDNRLAAWEISLPSSGSWDSNRTGQHNLHVKFTICGKTYETDFGV